LKRLFDFALHEVVVEHEEVGRRDVDGVLDDGLEGLLEFVDLAEDSGRETVIVMFVVEVDEVAQHCDLQNSILVSVCPVDARLLDVEDFYGFAEEFEGVDGFFFEHGLDSVGVEGPGQVFCKLPTCDWLGLGLGVREGGGNYLAEENVELMFTCWRIGEDDDLGIENVREDTLKRSM
jgi:hypothetical protein